MSYSGRLLRIAFIECREIFAIDRDARHNRDDYYALLLLIAGNFLPWMEMRVAIGMIITRYSY